MSPTTSTTTAVQRHGRATAGFDERVARALGVLRQAVAEHAGTLVQASSLGVEDMVVTDLAARHNLALPVATLDTGRLHAQTLTLVPRIAERYGVVVERFQPVADDVVHFVRAHGIDPMFRSVDLRKACCGLRKVEPLSRLLQGRTAWVTGLRRAQASSRGTVAAFEPDGSGRTKVSPLADWSLADVWHYVALHAVPYNPLHDAFFPSIGCAPCTRAVALGEDERAGRWWWEQADAKECGLHVHPAPAAGVPA